VQDFALELVQFLDNLEKKKRRSDLVKGALVASGKYKPEVLFPDFFPDRDEDEEVSDGDVDYDYSEVKWESPSTSGYEEFERIQALLGSTAVVVEEVEEHSMALSQGQIIGDAPVDDEPEEQDSVEWV
jgi:hypothetical protein